MIDVGNSRRVMPRPLVVALRPRPSYNILQSSMAAIQDVEQYQISSNPCVYGHLGHGIILINHSPGPAASLNPGTGYVNPSVLRRSLNNRPRSALKSPNRREAHPSYVSM